MNSTTITAIVRHLLGIASGYLIAKGVELDAATIEIVAGSVGSLLAVGWSLWAKRAPKE
jgi:hypothetical protein